MFNQHECVSDSALKFLKVITKIVKIYLLIDKEPTIFNTKEIFEIWACLNEICKSRDMAELNALLKGAFSQYIKPLPMRPLVGQLWGAHTQMLICFRKELGLDLDQHKEAIDKLFCYALANALMKTFPVYDDINQELLDSLVLHFKEEFSEHLNLEYSQLSRSCAPTPNQVYISQDARENLQTPSLFNENSQTVNTWVDGYDSELDEKIFECFV